MKNEFKLTHEVNMDSLRDGLKELEKLAVSELEYSMGKGDISLVRSKVEYALNIQPILESVLVNPHLIEDYFSKHKEELGKRFRIDIRGYKK